jgi:hypothetical protein
VASQQSKPYPHSNAMIYRRYPAQQLVSSA